MLNNCVSFSFSVLASIAWHLPTHTNSQIFALLAQRTQFLVVNQVARWSLAIPLIVIAKLPTLI